MTPKLERFKMSKKIYRLLLLTILLNISNAAEPKPSTVRLFSDNDGDDVNKNLTIVGEAKSAIFGGPLKLDSSILNTGATVGLNIDSQSRSVSNATTCNTIGGMRAHGVDCKKYYVCSSEGSQNGSFNLIEKSCPEKEAFNIELNRCSRDISSCPLNIKCNRREIKADPASNSSYYICEPRPNVRDFRIFRVYCGPNEIFDWLLKNCGVDLENLRWYNWDQPKDIDNVEAELKELKKQDELKLKESEKLRKETEKKAESSARQEAANFVCVKEGKFPSKFGDRFYINCIKNQDKFKSVFMRCNNGAIFFPQFGVCVNVDTNSESSADMEDFLKAILTHNS